MSVPPLGFLRYFKSDFETEKHKSSLLNEQSKTSQCVHISAYRGEGHFFFSFRVFSDCYLDYSCRVSFGDSKNEIGIIVLS